MKTFKKALRVLGIALLVLLAMMGVGVGAILPRVREQDMDNETKTELVEGEESTLSDRN